MRQVSTTRIVNRMSLHEGESAGKVPAEISQDEALAGIGAESFVVMILIQARRPGDSWSDMARDDENGGEASLCRKYRIHLISIRSAHGLRGLLEIAVLSTRVACTCGVYEMRKICS